MTDTEATTPPEALHAGASSAATLTFGSPSSPLDEIILNRHDTKPTILGSPEQAALLELLKDVEQRYIHSFWISVLCKRSPHAPHLPFGLDSWNKRTIPLISRAAVLHAVSTEYETIGRVVPEDINAVPFDTLVRGIHYLRPASILKALTLLTQAGAQRFNASSVIEVAHDCPDFYQALDRLIQMASLPQGRAAAMALIALRAAGFVVLPSSFVRRVRSFDSHGSADCWGSLMDLLTPGLKELYEKLQPPTRRQGEAFCKNSAYRIYSAILSTNVRSVGDVSWPLLYSQLKGADFEPELRNHWRLLCRANGKEHHAYIPTSDDQSQMSTHIWPSLPVPSTELGNCETLTDPSGISPELLLNIHSNAALLLHDVTRDDLTPVLQQIEHRWIETFWSTLTSQSPYNRALPFALDANQSGHTLVDPILLASLRSGYCDLHSKEAMKELRRLPRNQLTRLINQCRPDTIAACHGVLTKSGEERFKGFSLHNTARRSASFQEFVQTLVTTAIGEDSGKALALAALIALRSQHWLVLPLSIQRSLSNVQRGISSTTTEWIRDPILELSGEPRQLMNSLLGSQRLGNSDRHKSCLESMATIAILCSNLRSCEQLSLAFIERILAGAHDTAVLSPAKDNVLIRKRWTRLCERNGPIAMLPPKKFQQDHRSELTNRCDDPRLTEWIDLLSERCNVHTGGNLEPVYQAYSTWLSWLSSLPEIPGVFEISRPHIRGNGVPWRCYREHLQGLEGLPKHKNKLLYRLNDVFEHLATQAEADGIHFINPIRIDLDKFPTDSSLTGQGTYRSRIPALTLDEMKVLIVEPMADGSFRWSPHLNSIQMLFTPELELADKVFCPILPAIIYIMLVFPLRTHQVRWLDSMEMDEEKYDFVTNRFLPNYEHGIKGRRSGVVQPAQSSSPSPESLLDFQVAVNKTTLTQRTRSSYTIPFLPPDVLWVLKEVSAYQKQYGPPAHLVKEVHEPVYRRRRNQGLAGLYPDICPLFRYREQRSFYPPSHTQIAYFWGKLCALWDALNSNWVNRTTGRVETRPGVPKMARPYIGKQGNKWWVANFDLHSLRVASVSTLLEAGLPLAMVAALAGHKSLAMTIHYFKPDMALLRIKLKEAYTNIPPGITAYTIAKYLHETEEEGIFLGNPKGLEKLRTVRKTGLPTISAFGICPGTSCQEGFETDYGSNGVTGVPGSRCALCRFFVYGPAFLPGLVFEFNCVLTEIERKAKVQAQIREATLRAEDEGKVGEALQLRAEDDRIDRESSLDIAVLGRLYVILNECIDAYNTRPETLNGLQIISQDTKLEVVLKQVTRFEQLKELVEVSQILPAGRHASLALAELELKDILLDMLRRNGAEAYFAGLPKDITRTATIELAQLLESMVPDSDKRDRLLHGLMSLSDTPGLEEGLKQLMSRTHSEVLRLQQKHQTLPAPRTWLNRIALSRAEVNCA